jgi:putative ABC transport system ATP-binding protein
MTVSALQGSELYRFFHVGDDEVVALRGVDIAVKSGEFIALCGPSGSGKSTLLACLAGLDEPDGGTVTLMGERMTRRPEFERSRLRARYLGMLMQAGNLFEHLTIRASILLQMKISGRGDPAEIAGLLASLGLDDLAEARPAQLSGGEAARAGLAVAIAAKPPILLCDEPTAEVDAQTERRVVDRLIELRHDGTGILVVTHSEALAARADRVIGIQDGRLVDD